MKTVKTDLHVTVKEDELLRMRAELARVLDTMECAIQSATALYERLAEKCELVEQMKDTSDPFGLEWRKQ